MSTDNVKKLMSKLMQLQDDIGDKFEDLLRQADFEDKTEADRLIEDINKLIDDTNDIIKEFSLYPDECVKYQQEECIPLGNCFEEAFHGIELVKTGIEMVQLKRQVEEEYV